MQPLADGNLALGLLNDTLIYIVNVTDGTLVKTLLGGPLSFQATGLDLIDNTTLISSSMTTFVITWNLNTAGFTRYFDMSISSLLLNAYTIKYLSSNMIAVGGSSSIIYVFDIKGGTIIASLSGHTAAVYALELIDATTLASGSADTRIIIWDLSIMQQKYVLGNHLSTVRCLKLISANKLASGSDDLSLNIWNLNSRFLWHFSRGLLSPVYFLEALDENLYIIGSQNGNVEIRSSSTMSLLKKANDGSSLYSMKKLNVLSRKFTHFNSAECLLLIVIKRHIK